MELESVEFHRKVRKGFVSLARRFPKLFTKIDGRKEIEAIEARIQKEVKAYL
jgi:thymidylate kinase